MRFKGRLFFLKNILTYIEVRYNIVIRYIEPRYIIERDELLMEDKLKRIYIPMTETGFYILFALKEERHGYNIIQYVKELTNQEIIISAGTMYGSLGKMEKDGLIQVVKEEDRRKSYLITSLGEEVLNHEINRIKRLYKNSIGERLDEN